MRGPAVDHMCATTRTTIKMGLALGGGLEWQRTIAVRDVADDDDGTRVAGRTNGPEHNFSLFCILLCISTIFLWNENVNDL